MWTREQIRDFIIEHKSTFEITISSWNMYNFNIHWKHKVTNRYSDEKWFMFFKLHKTTFWEFWPDWFNIDGYDKYGYNEDGFNKGGYYKDGYDRWGYDNHGYDKDGYDRVGNDNQGYDKNGYDMFGKSKYNIDGYDKDGFDREGFNKEGYDKLGYDNQGYNFFWFNLEWINKSTNTFINKYWFNHEGCNTITSTLYDTKWFNFLWFNDLWFHRWWWNIDWFESLSDKQKQVISMTVLKNMQATKDFKKKYSLRESSDNYRVTRCRNCKKWISNDIYPECIICNWIICPCWICSPSCYAINHKKL